MNAYLREIEQLAIAYARAWILAIYRGVGPWQFLAAGMALFLACRAGVWTSNDPSMAREAWSFFGAMALITSAVCSMFASNRNEP